jgi:hypothetical protein
VTLYPSDVPRPNVWNLYFTANQIVPSAFTVRLGGDGGFKIYTSGATHFIVDITGYYAPPGAGGLYYHPLPAPVRLLETRPAYLGQGCNTPGTPLLGGTDRLVIARGACTGVPSSALAIVGNATVVNNPSLSNSGHVTLYPSNAPRPNASNLNYIAGQIVPNAFTVGLGGDGGFKIYTFGTIHFLVDITGYYSTEAVDANGAGLLYNPLTAPLRLLDTRPGSQACNTPGAPLLGNTDTLQIARGACTGVPSSALAIVGNGTVVNNPSLSNSGHVTLYPSNASRPDVSNLNYIANQIVANAFTVGLGGDGGFKIFTFGTIHFIVDLTGYFAPALVTNCPTITIAPAALPGGTVGTAYGQTITPSGGSSPYTFTSTGALPTGLTLAPGPAATTTLSGTPTTGGPFNFTVTATDANGCAGSQSYTVNICAPPVITTQPSSQTAVVGGNASFTAAASGSPAPTVQWQVSVDGGVTFNNISGATNSTLTLTSVTLAQNGNRYRAVFTNACGSAMSAAATLTVGEMAGLQYYPLPAPVRLLDTRPEYLGQGCNTPGAPLLGGTDTLQIARGACTGVPNSALAIVGNVTVVNNPSLSTGGPVTLYPSDVPRPNVWNLYFTANQIVPSAFTVRLGGDGGFKIYTSGATHFIVDITGYYAPPGAGGLYYHPLPAPVRLLETRPAYLGQGCNTPGTPLLGGTDRLVIARGACTGVPSSALAIVGNATVVNNPSLSNSGHVTLYPSNAPRPNASNLNYIAGQIVPNAFTVGLGGDGGFKIYTFGTIHFLVDITGYYSTEAVDANGAGLLYNPLTAPLRLLDTRPGSQACNTPGAPLLGNTDTLQIARGACTGVPSSALAIVGNGTVVNNPSLSNSGHVTLYPSNASRPDVSNLNYIANQIVANAFTVGLGGDGGFKIFTFGTIHFIVDLTGYFAP